MFYSTHLNDDKVRNDHTVNYCEIANLKCIMSAIPARGLNFKFVLLNVRRF